MANVYYNSQGERIKLSARIGVGAEGEVFQVNGRAGLVAKIYYQPPAEEKAEKLLVLTRLKSEKLLKFAGWPVDVLYQTPGGQIAGFVMKRIIQAEEVHTLHSPKSRLDKFPQASWPFLIYVAANFARAVAAMHEHGFVIGDVNPKNTLVTRKATVFLLDCDSFQVLAEGKTYRCEGGFPEYTPREMHGMSFREIDRKQEHDHFGLAVVIFQLLFLGRHPFSGRYLGVGEMPLEQSIKELRFAYGEDAEGRQMRQPPGTPVLEVVTPALVQLFRRAFLSRSAADRPTALEWIEPLESLTKSLSRCAQHSGHHYYRELTACPWCEIEVHARVRLFNLSNGGLNKTSFHLSDVWKEIAAVLPPREDIATVNLSPADLPQSVEALELERKRGRDFRTSIGFSLIAGLLIGLINLPIDYWMLLGGMIIAYLLTNVGYDRLNTSHPNKFMAFDSHPVVDLIYEKNREAEINAHKMEEKWKNEAATDRFLVKLQNLENQRDAYKNLPKIREWKLKELESIGRDAQLNEYLGRIIVKDIYIKGIKHGIQASLHIFGIKTAADITAERIKQTWGIGTPHGERLIAWRRELERQFVFDHARAVPPHARVKVEREIDNLRIRLETELKSGALYLHRLKHQIEENRKELLPALTDARRLLAEATNDINLIKKRNRIIPAIIFLFIAFFIGLSINNIMNRGAHVEQRVSQPVDSPLRWGRSPAQVLYEDGIQFKQAGNYQDAVVKLVQAVQLDPYMIPAFEALGFSFHKLKDYRLSVRAWKKAIELGSKNFNTYYSLGTVYIDQQDWWAAEDSLKKALTGHDKWTGWTVDYIEAHYKLGRSIVEGGREANEIAALENSLKDSDNLEDRFRLAILNLWIGNDEKVMREYKKLKEKKSVLAEELIGLMEWHKGG